MGGSATGVLITDKSRGRCGDESSLSQPEKTRHNKVYFRRRFSTNSCLTKLSKRPQRVKVGCDHKARRRLNESAPPSFLPKGRQDALLLRSATGQRPRYR